MSKYNPRREREKEWGEWVDIINMIGSYLQNELFSLQYTAQESLKVEVTGWDVWYECKRRKWRLWEYIG